ncbi:MAG: threonine synthase [Nanoarchaeota archaeon]|nr:threonine synthase [Nanoarchaeota archaeon]
MHVLYLKCFECGKTYLDTRPRYRCDCGDPLDIVYNYNEIKRKISWTKLRKRKFGHWRYIEFYPIIKNKNIISLGEGATPLVKARRLCKKKPTLNNLYFKCEGENQTGSFKDRGTTVELSKALEFGAKKIVVASTGNMGASISAYSAAAGIKAKIYVPKGAPKEKLQQIKNYGAKVVNVDGTYKKAAELAYRDFKSGKAYLMGDYAYRGEGEKSIAYEIMDKINAKYIICPIGNGTLISGVWKGLKELKAVGLIKKLPILIGVQATGCSPVVTAYQKYKEIVPVKPRTIASAIACGDPSDGDKALVALFESKGHGVTVDDKDILAARREMAKNEGLDCEPSGAVAYAGLKKLKLPKNAIKVAVVTGHGLKDLKNV